MTDGLTEEQLRHPVNEGKWSAHQNIAHLASYQPVFFGRMKRIAQGDQPSFERYVPDNDPPFLEAVAQPTSKLIEQISNDRREIYNYLTSLGQASIYKAGVHLRYGRLTVAQWTEFFLLHEAHHLFTIFMLTSDLRKMQAQEIITFTK